MMKKEHGRAVSNPRPSNFQANIFTKQILTPKTTTLICFYNTAWRISIKESYYGKTIQPSKINKKGIRFKPLAIQILRLSLSAHLRPTAKLYLCDGYNIRLTSYFSSV